MVQVVECLPSKHEALSSNPNTAKKKKKREGGHEITAEKRERESDNCEILSRMLSSLFSVALTEYGRMGNLQRISIYVAHSSGG
jgi:hypothetical protein